ncbi:MAG TPA: hydrogenase maturation nickel metallochaperone HypA [Nitrospirae bacterium]|nr:hydrogenase maturation nickel metallochaperone HypA [Nitrospirota bacterium]
MHEVSIVLGMVDELMKIAGENDAKKIINVKLKIGKMSGIVADSLKFVFDAIKPEHPMLSSAEIIIEEIPLIYECSDCRTAFNTDDIYFPCCPDCESYNLKILSGEEQHIENVEIET